MYYLDDRWRRQSLVLPRPDNLLQPAAQQVERVQCEEYGLCLETQPPSTSRSTLLGIKNSWEIFLAQEQRSDERRKTA